MPIRRSPNGAGHVRPQPGRNRPEWVVAINRNAWSQSVGTGGRNHPVRASMIQAGTMVAIHIIAANLRQADYFMGVYGNWAIKPLDNEQNGFCVSELDSGALTAGDLRTCGDLLAVRNVKLIDTCGFFDRLQSFVGWQLAQPGTQIDVESFGRYGQQMRDLVESIRRQHQALN